MLAPDLDRLVQNLLLYTNTKAVRLREILFVSNGKTLQGFACDDYIAVTEQIDVELNRSSEFAMELEEAERFGDWIKKDKKVIHKTLIDLTIFNTYIKVREQDGEIEKFAIKKPEHEAWDTVMDLLSEENDQKLIADFAVRPDRFAKLARLKADKEAPLMFRGIDVNGHLVLQFKKGLTIRGAAMPIRQEFIQEEFLWENTEMDTQGTVNLLVPTDQFLSSTSTESVPSNTD